MQLGDYGVAVVRDTEFKLDGGAMFGVVPRVFWERLCPPDELNRIPQQTNCLFIDTGRDKVLIETGMGEKWSPKDHSIYGINRTKSFADSLFDETGCNPEDITIVINTHLHFDHAGGNTVNAVSADRGLRIADSSGRASGGTPQIADTDSANTNPLSAIHIPQFPNARYLVSARELAHAESPHERDRASYLPENWQPMIETGQLEAMPDEYEPIPGLKLQTIRGHSETMQTWRLDRGGQTMYGFADLIPTRHHLPLPWIMGYDLYPTETLAFKKQILPQAVAENWLCLFYHDIDQPLCRLAVENGKLKAVGIEI